MRAFDWKALFAKQRIHYIERGANVKRSEINIKCPWCGSADPSQHMGINLDTGWYSCWRNKHGHSGKSPLRLIMKLLDVSYGAARELAGLGEDYVDPEGFSAMAAKLMGRGVEAQPVKAQPSLVYDRDFRPIDDESCVATRRWWNYLFSRGFDADDVVPLATAYELMACRRGAYADRLIIPYVVHGKLTAWTGRAIGGAQIRYKDLPIDESVIPIKQTLFNHDATLDERATVLVVVEGPMDALKVDFYGSQFGVRAVGLSTNSLTESQVFALEDAAENFERVITLMDNKTGFGVVDSMRMRQTLARVKNIESAAVPFDRPDPGELRPGEVEKWARSLTHGSTRA